MNNRWSGEKEREKRVESFSNLLQDLRPCNFLTWHIPSNERGTLNQNLRQYPK